LWGQSCILASRLHILIQILVLFACFGCVVINHQKKGDCKENGPQAFWLIEFWCLMINTACGLICLLVFIIIVHRMRRELDQGNEDATPQKKI
jgi:heme/copper-type cytochrome/quinol oxidase subunit 2